MYHKKSSLNKQLGVILVTSLVILLALTLIGLTGIKSTSLEEKMAGNNHDKNIAFQAAEVALRDAESDILSTRISGISGMDATCTDGLCYTGSNSFMSDIWNDTTKTDNAWTTATLVPDVASQPRYLIEAVKRWPPGGTGWKYYYTITAIAQGAQDTTISILQTVYTP